MKKNIEYQNNKEKIKRIIIQILDFFENIDINLYGKKFKYISFFSIIVVIIAPIIDWIIKSEKNNLTFFITILFIIFILIILLSWLSSFRDEYGKWSIRRMIFRLSCFKDFILDSIKEKNKSDSINKIFYLGIGLLISGIIIKAFQNISVIIRRPIEHLIHHKILFLISFEHFTFYFYIFICIGSLFLLITYIKNRDLFNFFKIFGFFKENKSKVIGTLHIGNNNIINLRNKDDVKNLLDINQDKEIQSVIKFLSEWYPKKGNSEKDYEDLLEFYLNKKLTNMDIIKHPYLHNDTKTFKRFPDFSINNYILIELKKTDISKDLQRAKGQIDDYLVLTENKGILILLFCKVNINRIKESLNNFLQQQTQLKKNLLTFIIPE